MPQEEKHKRAKTDIKYADAEAIKSVMKEYDMEYLLDGDWFGDRYLHGGVSLYPTPLTLAERTLTSDQISTLSYFCGELLDYIYSPDGRDTSEFPSDFFSTDKKMKEIGHWLVGNLKGELTQDYNMTCDEVKDALADEGYYVPKDSDSKFYHQQFMLAVFEATGKLAAEQIANDCKDFKYGEEDIDVVPGNKAKYGTPKYKAKLAAYVNKLNGTN